MKRLMMAIGVLLLLSSLAFSEPFLVCDPQPEAIKYRIRLSADAGTTWGPFVEGPPVNSAMRFDLNNTPVGNYTGEAQAAGSYEVTDSISGQISSIEYWSAPAPFVLKVKPGKTPEKVKTTK